MSEEDKTKTEESLPVLTRKRAKELLSSMVGRHFSYAEAVMEITYVNNRKDKITARIANEIKD